MHNKEVVIVKDINGSYCAIPYRELMEEMSTQLVFGLSLKDIMELRNQYLLIGGSIPASPDSIRKAFKERNAPCC